MVIGIGIRIVVIGIGIIRPNSENLTSGKIKSFFLDKCFSINIYGEKDVLFPI